VIELAEECLLCKEKLVYRNKDEIINY